MGCTACPGTPPKQGLRARPDRRETTRVSYHRRDCAPTATGGGSPLRAVREDAATTVGR